MIAVYDDLIARFGTATDLSLREYAFDALLAKCQTLVSMFDRQEAIALLRNFSDQFGATSDVRLFKMAERAKHEADLIEEDLLEYEYWRKQENKGVLKHLRRFFRL